MNEIGEDTGSKQHSEENAYFSTETRVKILDSSKKEILNGLLDSGTNGTHIKRSALKSVQYVYERANVRVHGRYASSNIKEIKKIQVSSYRLL